MPKIILNNTGSIKTIENADILQGSKGNILTIEYEDKFDFDFIQVNYRLPDGTVTRLYNTTIIYDNYLAKYVAQTIIPDECTNLLINGRRTQINVNVSAYTNRSGYIRLLKTTPATIYVIYDDNSKVPTTVTETESNEILTNLADVNKHITSIEHGGIVVDAAYKDDKGNVISETYVKLSDVEDIVKRLLNDINR